LNIHLKTYNFLHIEIQVPIMQDNEVNILQTQYPEMVNVSSELPSTVLAMEHVLETTGSTVRAHFLRLDPAKLLNIKYRLFNERWTDWGLG
jgi:hypothetical protein